MMQYTIKTKIRKKINGWVGRESRTRSSWRRARGEPRLIDPWRGGLVNVTQSNGSASLKCQLYPDKPSRFILIEIAQYRGTQPYDHVIIALKSFCHQ